MDDDLPFDQDLDPFPRRGPRAARPKRNRVPAFTTDARGAELTPEGAPIPRRRRISGFYDPMRFMLGPVEKVMLHDGPSGQAVLERLPLWMLATAALVVAWHFASDGWPGADLLAVLLALYLLVVVPWRIVQWKSTHYILTNKRVMTVHGLWRRHAASIPLDRVTDVTFDQSFFEKLVGIGTIKVLSASEESNVRELGYVRDPDAVYRFLLRLVHESKDLIPPGAPPLPVAPPSGVQPWEQTRPQGPVSPTLEL